jgi:hypothetical protein
MVDFIFHSRDFLLPLQLITQMSATNLDKKIELFASRLKKSVFLSWKDTNL